MTKGALSGGADVCLMMSGICWLQSASGIERAVDGDGAVVVVEVEAGPAAGDCTRVGGGPAMSSV